MKLAAALIALICLAGCASKKPIIDKKGVDMAAYAQDLEECQTYATEVDKTGKVAGGAAAGAVVGGAIGAVFNGSRGASRGAGAGAIGGAAKGAASGEREQAQVVKNCLRGRGYRVLN